MTTFEAPLNPYQDIISTATGVTDREYLASLEQSVRGSFNSGLSNLSRDEIAAEGQRAYASMRRRYPVDYAMKVLGYIEYSLDGHVVRGPSSEEFDRAMMILRNELKDRANG